MLVFCVCALSPEGACTRPRCLLLATAMYARSHPPPPPLSPLSRHPLPPPPACALPPQFYLDPKPLLKLIFTKFLGSASGFVDVVAKHIPSPVANAQKKARESAAAA